MRNEQVRLIPQSSVLSPGSSREDIAELLLVLLCLLADVVEVHGDQPELVEAGAAGRRRQVGPSGVEGFLWEQRLRLVRQHEFGQQPGRLRMRRALDDASWG